MKRLIKFVTSILILLSSFGLVVLWIFKLETYFYWWLLIVWTYMILNLKFYSYHTLIVAISVFLIGTILATGRLLNIAEFIIRTSFVFWIMGITQALIELKKQEQSVQADEAT